MKIGIDVRAACGRKAGKGWYTYNLVKELLALDKKNEYILYTNVITKDLSAFGNSQIKLIKGNKLLWHFNVMQDWKRETLRHGSGLARDLFFAPTSFIVPAFLPKEFASVITVHDLVAFLHPRMHQAKATIIEKLTLRRALKKTRAVLVPSENTKRDLMQLFDYPAGKIFVTPLGVGREFFAEVNDVARAAEVKKKYCLPEEFILTVGGLEPRKNVGGLVDAFHLISKKHPNVKLVIVGGKGWKSRKVQEKIEKKKDQILWIQNCDSEDLPTMYRLAKVFVFPSLYEGFGLPPLEAMASGCPVICSNAASLPDVVGDAALAFSPNDSQRLAEQLQAVLKNPQLRKELIEKGRKRAAQFSWEKTAEKTLEVFKKVKSTRGEV